MNVNIRDLPPQTKLYRYVRLGHLLSDIENGVFTLQSVKKWDDWTEQMLDFLYASRDKESCVQSSYGMDHIYGSCWTRKNNWSTRWDTESPNYNKEENGSQKYTCRTSSFDNDIKYLLSKQEEKMLKCSKVCITSTVGKLQGILAGREHRTGIVKYLSNHDFFELCTSIKEQIINNERKHSLTDFYSKVIFYKRLPFSYEKEYRLIVFEGDLEQKVPDKTFSDLTRVKWNPVDCIGTISLHPLYQLNMSFKQASVILDRMALQDKVQTYSYIRYLAHIISELYSAFSKYGVREEKIGFLMHEKIDLSDYYGAYNPDDTPEHAIETIRAKLKEANSFIEKRS